MRKSRPGSTSSPAGVDESELVLPGGIGRRRAAAARRAPRAGKLVSSRVDGRGLELDHARAPRPRRARRGRRRRVPDDRSGRQPPWRPRRSWRRRSSSSASVCAGGDAEARAREQQRRRRVADDNDGDVALQARLREVVDLLGVVEHDRDDGRVDVAEHAAADADQARAEAVRVGGAASPCAACRSRPPARRRP